MTWASSCSLGQSHRPGFQTFSSTSDFIQSEREDLLSSQSMGSAEFQLAHVPHMVLGFTLMSSPGQTVLDTESPCVPCAPMLPRVSVWPRLAWACSGRDKTEAMAGCCPVALGPAVTLRGLEGTKVLRALGGGLSVSEDSKMRLAPPSSSQRPTTVRSPQQRSGCRGLHRVRLRGQSPRRPLPEGRR